MKVWTLGPRDDISQQPEQLGTVRPVKVFLETYVSILRNIHYLFILGAVPLLICHAAGGWLYRWVESVDARVTDDGSGLPIEPIQLALFSIITRSDDFPDPLHMLVYYWPIWVFGAFWLRALLRGDRTWRWVALAPWGKVFWAFLAYVILFQLVFEFFGILGAIAVLLAKEVSGYLVLGVFVAYLALGLFLVARIWLVFPLVSVGESAALGAGLRYSRSQATRALVSVLFVLLPWLVVKFAWRWPFSLLSRDDGLRQQVEEVATLVILWLAPPVWQSPGPYLVTTASTFLWATLMLTALAVIYRQVVTPDVAKAADIFGEA